MYCGDIPHLSDKKGCTKCLAHQVEINNRYSKKNRDKIKAYHRKIRQEVISKYGGKCVCCGETDWRFLAIDHVSQNGGEERKQLYGSQNGSSGAWYLKLRREHLREDLRVLCHNCNMAVFQFGECPHEQAKEANQNVIP